jgi:hypothetical protein
MSDERKMNILSSIYNLLLRDYSFFLASREYFNQESVHLLSNSEGEAVLTEKIK